MMLKNYLLTAVVFVLIQTGISAYGTDVKGRAGEPDQGPALGSATLLKGVATIADSSISPVTISTKDSTSPTEGFENLFEVKETSDEKATVRLNSKAIRYVEDYMDRNSDKLMKIKERSRPYFRLMDGILIQYGLPKELKYLAVIESEMKLTARSPVGAVGPWQFMPATARNYGLKIYNGRDDRKDFNKSTHAAAKYLKALYKEFGDWLLVIAAYNGGSGVVYNAMKKSKSKNFWDLQYYLPTESRNHVKKFIGTHYVFEGEGGITTLTRKEAGEQVGVGKGKVLLRNLTNDEKRTAESLHIAGKYHSEVIAKHLLMDISEFKRYNPGFDKVIAAAENSYELMLPAEKMDMFLEQKFQILEESIYVLLNGTPVEGVQNAVVIN